MTPWIPQPICCHSSTASERFYIMKYRRPYPKTAQKRWAEIFSRSSRASKGTLRRTSESWQLWWTWRGSFHFTKRKREKKKGVKIMRKERAYMLLEKLTSREVILLKRILIHVKKKNRFTSVATINAYTLFFIRKHFIRISRLKFAKF